MISGLVTIISLVLLLQTGYAMVGTFVNDLPRVFK